VPRPKAAVKIPEDIREWRQPLNRADSIGILGILVGGFFVLIVPTIWYKIPALILLSFGIVYLIWLSHWTHHLNRLWRSIIATVALAFVSWGVVPQLMEQWRIEHMFSELSFSARAPGLMYPDGERYGIKWSKPLAEVRLTVTSNAKFPIQNLTLSVWTTNKTDEIAGMAQTDQEPQGCVVRRPREQLVPPLILRGQDGSRADISPDANDEVNKDMPFRNHYDLLCQRILAGESIPLVIGALTQQKNGEMFAPPGQLRIKGDYETTAVEGSKRVPVDELITIATLPRWK
jgi:hypothetical protein